MTTSSYCIEKFDKAQIADLQMSDLDIKIIYKWKTGSEKPEWTEIFPDT